MKNNGISKTEDAVFRLKMQGFSQKEIAYKTFRSQSTVQAHLRNIYHKIGVQNEIEAYNWYLENKLHIDIKRMLQVGACLFLLLFIEIKGSTDIRRPQRTRIPYRTEIRTRNTKKEVA